MNINIYGKENVYEAAKRRIREIFDTHYGKKPISVSFSGGKDSTVILFLVKEIMDERGIDKIPVFWLDQELETLECVDFTRQIMSLPWVMPYWVQSEFPHWNAQSGTQIYCWQKGIKWCREKEPSGTYTDFDISDWKKYNSEYECFQYKCFGNSVTIGGLHADESPTRRLSLFRQLPNIPQKKGKYVTVYYPLYDWVVNDIWYYIFSNNLPYCKYYNYMFSRFKLLECRVGSFLNPQSHKDLILLKEVSPLYYDRVINRLEGSNSTYHSYSMLMDYVRELPPYFASWKEYVLYLVEKLVPLNFKDKVTKKYLYSRKKYLSMCNEKDNNIKKIEELIGRSVAYSIVKEDYDMRALSAREYECLKIATK